MGIVIRRNRNIQENLAIRQDVKNIDLEKGSITEQVKADYGSYEYSGWHKSTISSYLDGMHGSPYSRQYNSKGELVACGINWYDRMVQQQEMLIQSTGEPVVLLRRKWTGELCPCYNKPRNRAEGRCPICFSTGYVGGYVRFINTKESNGRIWIRLSPNLEDLKSQEHGMWQENEPSGWTLPTPTLRDRDVIIRYDPATGDESWRYEIQSVTRNQGFFNVHTSQQFTMKRLDKTHPINAVRLVDLLNDQVGDLRGAGDEWQDKIEAEHGDGYQDGGFSLGYLSGYDQSFHAAFYGKDISGIPDDNLDGYADKPFGPADGLSDNAGSGLEFWLDGFREGFIDGTEDGQKMRLEKMPPERLEMEKRRVDLPSNTLEHPNPRADDPRTRP